MAMPIGKAFKTSTLGWMAFAVCDKFLHELTFGRKSKKAALAQLSVPLCCSVQSENLCWHADVIRKLNDYANGQAIDFTDIRLKLDGFSPFHRRILLQCQRIPFGHTITYTNLAARSGSPRAARAVGNAMARNRFPLVVPCHRVVRSDGELGGFSAPQGIKMKQRLLEMEGVKI